MIELDGHHLDLEGADAVVFEAEPVSLASAALARVAASRRTVEALLARGERVYGLNTGFGKLSERAISAEELARLQLNLLRSHAVGLGPFLPAPVARAALLFRLNALLCGVSGVRTALVERLAELLNRGVVPLIPAKGSVGSSGDLAPLAHLGLVLIGEGQARWNGRVFDGAALHAALGLEPLTLEPKEGLALINGTQVTLAMLYVAHRRARGLLEAAVDLTALALEAYGAQADPLDAQLHAQRPHPGQVEVARRLRERLAGSRLLGANGHVQDPYSLRCAPQVLGASRDALDWVAERLVIEMNAATDNPLIVAGRALSGGNFHGQILALAAELAGIALAELGQLAERQLALLLEVPDLPEFLVEERGVNSGLMLTQYAAAALVAENKVLAHPAAVDSIPTSAGQEDHNSMAATSAYKLLTLAENVAEILALELLVVRQALSFRDVTRLAPATRALYQACAARVPPLTEDRFLGQDVRACKDLLHELYGTGNV